MSFKKFRTLDLILLGFLAVLAEVLGIVGAKTIFEANSPLSFVLTVSLPIVILTTIRWKTYGLYVMPFVGLASFLSIGYINLEYFMIYGIGYLGVGLSYLWIVYKKSEEIKEDWIITTLYYLTAYVGMILLQSLIAVMFGNNFLNFVLNLLIKRYLLSIVIGWVVLMIIRRQPSTMIDMKKYLLRLHKGEPNDE